MKVSVQIRTTARASSPGQGQGRIRRGMHRPALHSLPWPPGRSA